MNVKMGHGLAGVRPAVGHYTVAAAQALTRSDYRDGAQAFGKAPVVSRPDIVQGCAVFLRDHQNMNGRLGIDIPESEHIFVLIDYF